MTLILSGTDGLSDVDGSAATPAIRGTDANTGIFFPAADTIAFSEGGVESMRIDSSGNVGIGTSSPARKLDVTGTGRVTGEMLFGADAQLTNDAYVYTTSGGGGVRAGWLLDGTNQAVRGYTAGTERMRIDSSGNLLVGTTSSLNARIGIVSSSGTASINCGDGQDSTAFGIVQIVRAANQPDNKFHISFVRTGNKVAGMGFLDNSDTFAVQNTGDNSGNGVTLGNAATSWGTTSDERKKDIKGTIENALVKLANWRTVYFSYKNDEHNESRVGLIAQDIQATLPEAVSVETDEIGTLQLRYTEVIPVLVKAIQEQQAIITQLQADVAALKAPQGTP